MSTLRILLLFFLPLLNPLISAGATENLEFHLDSSTIINSDLDSIYPNAKYLNPCSSNSFAGDVALSDDERDSFLEKDIFLSSQPSQIWFSYSDNSTTNNNQSSAINVTHYDKHSIIENLNSISPSILESTLNNRNLTRKDVRRIWRNYYISLGVHEVERRRLVHSKLLQWRQRTSPLHSPHVRNNATFNEHDAPKKRVKRAATAYSSRTWPDGVIPYLIMGNFSTETKATIMRAMRHWENFTCLSFIEREPNHKSYIIFTEKSCGCCSYVGRRSSEEPQAISIGRNCDKRGIVIHELGHVIGFWHEHTRPDRDDHVEILLNNVVDGQDFNFKKMDPGEVNSLGEPYDYNSIMHYAKGTFAKANGAETIRPKKCCPRRAIGQRIRLSKGDVRQTNKLYKCPSCGHTLIEPSGTFSSPQLGAQSNPEEYALEGLLEFELDYDASYVISDTITKDDNDKMMNEHMQSDPKFVASSGEYQKNTPKLKPMETVRPTALHGKPIKSKAFHCQWRINASSGERIRLKFLRMDVYGVYPIYDKNAASGESNKCVHDYVEVRDGPFAGAPIIGRYCGATIPQEIISTGSRLWVEYRKSLNSESLGFIAEYEAICGGELRMESGRINSPSYPDVYQSNKKCIWKIIVPKGYSVGLTFHSFHIEKHENCVYDYIEIRDGLTEDSPKLTNHLCGMILPAPIKSTNNYMWIKFVSDGSVERSGFYASFEKEFDECKTIDHGCEHICENTFGAYKCTCHVGYELNSDGKRCDDACGGFLNGSSGYIQTPSYPNAYPRLKSCIWRISTKPKETIILDFERFDLEGTNLNCHYDFLMLYSGPDTNRKKIGTFCGSSLPERITSDSNMLTIEFYTDGSVEKTGFRAKWVTDMDECSAGEHDCEQLCINEIGSYKCQCEPGFELYNNKSCRQDEKSMCKREIFDNQGTIFSPNYPKPYGSSEQCWWKISTIPGHRIIVDIDEFNLEPHQSCDYDRVIVYDGPNEESDVLEKICGPRSPFQMVSKENNLMLTFKSDGSVNNKGFVAKYRTVCGGRLVAEETAKNIHSHVKFGEELYPPSTSCKWSIVAKNPQKRIRIRLVYFDLEYDGLCSYDFLAVYDGEPDDDKEARKYCGDLYPPSAYISNGNNVTLIFTSDANDERKGFNIQYELLTDDESYDSKLSPDEARDFRMDYRPDVQTTTTPSLPTLYKNNQKFSDRIQQSTGFRYKQPLWDSSDHQRDRSQAPIHYKAATQPTSAVNTMSNNYHSANIRSDSWTYRVPYSPKQQKRANSYPSFRSPHRVWTQYKSPIQSQPTRQNNNNFRQITSRSAANDQSYYHRMKLPSSPPAFINNIPKGNRYPTYHHNPSPIRRRSQTLYSNYSQKILKKPPQPKNMYKKSDRTYNVRVEKNNNSSTINYRLLNSKPNL